jgi:hypothetical protein
MALRNVCGWSPSASAVITLGLGARKTSPTLTCLGGKKVSMLKNFIVLFHLSSTRLGSIGLFEAQPVIARTNTLLEVAAAGLKSFR